MPRRQLVSAFVFLPAHCTSQEVGNDYCWGDPLLPLDRDDCCHDGPGNCFAKERYIHGRGPVTGEFNAIFARRKCCHRPANASSFFGFVNPVWHLVPENLEVAQYQITAEILEDVLGVRSPPGETVDLWDEIGLADRQVWSLVHSDAEVPRQLAAELRRFHRLGHFGGGAHSPSRTFDERRLRHRVGWLAYGEPLERHGQEILNTAHFVERAAQLLGWTNDKQSRFVNVGANNGIVGDPLGELLSVTLPEAWAVAVEVDPELCRVHRKNLPHVHLWCGAARPDQAWRFMDPWLPMEDSRLEEEGVLHVDILKVDIDSYDCVLVETLLRGSHSERLGHKLRLQPSLLLMEVNDAIPPPIQQAMLFSPALANLSFERAACEGNIPVAGCSLSYQVQHFARYGYRLLMHGAANAVYAHDSVLPTLAIAGYPGPIDEFDCYWNTIVASQCVSARQLRRWMHEGSAAGGGPMDAWQVLAEVHAHLKALEQHFGLPAVPMVLEV